MKETTVVVATEYPVANVQLLGGHVSAELMGRVETLAAADELAGVIVGISWVAARAAELGRPIRARVSSPLRTWQVAVDGTGDYTEIPATGPTPTDNGTAAAATSQTTPVRGTPPVESSSPVGPALEPTSPGVATIPAEYPAQPATVEWPTSPSPAAILESAGIDIPAEYSGAGPGSDPLDGPAVVASSGRNVSGGYGAATRQISSVSPPSRGWWPRRAQPMGPDPLVGLTQLTYLVANRKGESGKSPVSVLLAAAFATRRPGDVVLVDLNPVGNLALRTVTSSTATVSDLVAALHEAGRSGLGVDVDAYMQWQPDGYYALPSRDSLVVQQDGDDPTLAPRLSRHEVDLLAATLTGRRHVLGFDAGNNDADEAWQRAADLTDQLIVPVKWDPPTCTLAGQMLDDLARLGRTDLARSAIIVPTWSPAERVDRHRARSYEAYFRSAGHRVMPIPPDPHLAGKSIISWDQLKPATQNAALALAREIARGR